MLCILEIAMTVMGIMALIKGEVKLSKNKVVRAPMAYIIGVILTATFPIALMIGLGIGFYYGANGQELPMAAVLIDVVVIAIMGASAAVLAFTTAENPQNQFVADKGAIGGGPKDPNNPYAP